MTYEALLIDFDGVLRHFPETDAVLEAEFDLPLGAIRQIAFAPALLTRAICGEIDDSEWRSQIVTELALRSGGVRAHEAIARWSAAPGSVDNEVLDLLDRCRKKLRLVLVTNATSRLPCDLEALGLTQSFDAVINSADVGTAKPGVEIFRCALQRVGVASERALFIDDKAANVEAAVGLGIRGHVFVGAAPMAAFLRATGIFDLR